MIQRPIGVNIVRITNERVLGVTLHAFINDEYDATNKTRRPGIIVLPGGAYSYRSKRETDPIVFHFLSLGYQVFVLDYTVKRENIGERKIEREVLESIKLLREKSDEYSLFKDKIGLIGFSAGGHLALSACCHFSSILERPDFALLSYPVVTSNPLYCHEESFFNIAGESKEQREYYSLEKEISPSCPPLFIWHTLQDESVPAMNTILLIEELYKKKVKFEYHLFQDGKHGLSVCRKDTMGEEKRAQEWLNLSRSWLERVLEWNL